MKFSFLLFIAAFVSVTWFISILATGCAQIGSPTGGPRDSIPPELVSSTPKLLTTNFSANKVTLVFNEYIDVQDVQTNLLVSPFPKISPLVEFKLKTVTVKLKDTLIPNTTYAINFGNAIRDNNEGNPFKNFTYVFSTGNTIDSLQLRGKVIIAETGKKDSTILALLYQNVDDSAVQKRKPNYVAKLDSSGNFTFRNLSAGSYKIYALKDGDGGKTYNSKIELFAFADSEVLVTDSTRPVDLYAYAEEKDVKRTGTPASGTAKATSQADKKLKYTSTLSNNEQDLLTDFVITVNRPLKTFDPQKVILTDTNYSKVESAVTIDSTQKNIHIKAKWKEATHYRLLVGKDAISDSAGTELTKSDTIRFISKKETAYGSLTLRFSNLSAVNHPVLQFVKGDEIYKSIPVTAPIWSDKLFVPGEYELRILFDANNNGKWDPGNYNQKIQPERAITLVNKLNIKASWDNERDIKL
ncbi:MAG: Ig-like domain-containing protein [Ferruginibacter sp.]